MDIKGSFTIIKKELVSVQDSNGVDIKVGDPIIVRVAGKDIVCRFVGISHGYFVTMTLEDNIESKFRHMSIEKCTRIKGIHNLEEE